MAQGLSLSSLLEESRRLTTHLALAEIPAVQRGLDLLESESRKLVARAVRDGHGGSSTGAAAAVMDPRAQALLAGSGVDAERLLGAGAGAAAAAAVVSAFEQLQPGQDADVESFLGQQHEQAIVGAIEDRALATVRDADRAAHRHMLAVWEDAQRRLFDELGHHHHHHHHHAVADGALALMDPAREPLAFALRGQTAAGARVLQPRVERYAQVVRALNDARLAATTAAPSSRAPAFDLLAALERATADSSQELKSKQIAQAWRLLGHYARAAAAEAANGGSDAALVAGACAHLEEAFGEHVERTVAQYPHDASVGGVPSVHRRVQGYLAVQFGRLGRVPAFLEVFNGEAIWAHMYVLYRCGHRAELLQYALDMEDIITDSDPGFVAHLKAFFSEQSPALLLRGEAAVPVAASSLEDPYKAALYRVLGRGSVPRKAAAEVVHTTEDYLWSSLVLVRDAAAIAAATGHPRATLAGVQALILKYGAAHFDPHGANPLLYFRVLLLCGLLEPAVDHLLQADRFQIEAVHVAVLLAHSGLLRVTTATTDTATDGASFASFLVPDADDGDGGGSLRQRLDFYRMVVHYARALPEPAADDAVNYLLLLTLPGLGAGAGADSAAARRTQCQQALVRLLYERRDYAHFLGDIQSDGTRRRGYLERLAPLAGLATGDQFSRAIVRRLADRSRDEGRLADTVLLYNLAERYNAVLAVLCRQLGEVLYLRGSGNGATTAAADLSSPADAPLLVLGPDDVEGVARAVLDHYRQREHIARALDPRAVATCTTLLQLLAFLNSHRRMAYEEALATLQATQLLPLDADVARAAEHAERVAALDESITRNFSFILLAAMDTLARLYAGLAESPFVDAVKQASMLLLRRKARALMVFAGMLQFRMPSDTYAKLNRIEVSMS
ncbi:nuclear pore complex subunit [Coemansia javaensis]|uniref:Nuclear pore protein n=1 Tax=Coemansia javaensis TaxID=2761396 RepID=A0A9W8H724_9FUNG|nr:nuclear pore complex subunit [Coemansia javaensis]